MGGAWCNGLHVCFPSLSPMLLLMCCFDLLVCKGMLSSFHTICSKGRESCLGVTLKRINIGMRSNEYKPISLNRSIMIDVTNLCISIPI